ncbi:RAB6-interacting golgin [Dillenia turbinata]|uniref:RAB6-interacting golgin n=1 Tax=Dillenia turbinata TaxID=194707 RepID=A0AAN8V4S6_9MAGN
MAAQRQSWESQNPLVQPKKNSGTISYNVSPLKDEGDEDISKSALTAFRAKEEEIERKKTEVKERVQAQLGRVEEETKRLAEIREEKEYKEAVEAFNEKNREKAQLITKLVELVSESEKLRMKKLEELSKSIDSLH